MASSVLTDAVERRLTTRLTVAQTRSVEGGPLRRVWKRLLYLRFLLLQRHRYGRLALEWVDQRPFLVLPEVFNPGLFASGRLLARAVEQRDDLLAPGARVLDLGTGSGIGAVAAARKARSDLFEPLAPDEHFEVVLFNPPYYRGRPRDALDQAWRSPDVIERFAAGLPNVLAPGGHALVVLSSDGERDAFLDAFRAHGLSVDVAAGQTLLNETLTVYRVQSDQQSAVGTPRAPGQLMADS